MGEGDSKNYYSMCATLLEKNKKKGVICSVKKGGQKTNEKPFRNQKKWFERVTWQCLDF